MLELHGLSLPEPKFFPQDLDSNGKPLLPHRTAAIDLSAGKAPNPVYLHYKKVFAALYGQPIQITDSAMVSLLIEVVGLADISEYLGCIQTVQKSIEAALLSQGQLLWQAVANNPAIWSDMAIRIKSSSILQESVLHLAGNWNAIDHEVKKLHVSEVVRPLVEVQRQKLIDYCRKVERRLISWFPDLVTREARITGPEHTRSTYGNDVYVWMALCVFRQFLSTAFSRDMHHSCKDGGYALYRTIAAGTYLSSEELTHFHEKFPMSTRGKSTLRDHLRVIQNHVKTFVQPLLVNEAQLDVDRFAIGHLTCVKVAKEDVSTALAESHATGQSTALGKDPEVQASEFNYDSSDGESSVEADAMQHESF